MSVSRRNFVKSAAASVVAIPLVGLTNHDATGIMSYKSQQTKICAFTKLFQFLDYDQLAEVFAAAGLDGYDLTVRSGGHVEPENVKKDLPRVVKGETSLHIEYPVLTTEEAALPIKKKMEIALKIIKKDAYMLKSIMHKNNFN